MIPLPFSWKIALLAIIAIAGIGLFSYITILRMEIQTLTTENKRLGQQYELCQKDNERLASSIKEQNAEVEKFKNAADKRLKERQQELDRVKQEAKSLKDRAAGLISVLPPRDTDLCVAANDLINEEIKRNEK